MRWKFPAPFATVERMHFLALFDQQADRATVGIEHAGIHCEADETGIGAKDMFKHREASIRATVVSS